MLSLLCGRGTWDLEQGTFIRGIVPADNDPSLVFMREIVPADNALSFAWQGNMGPGTWNIFEGNIPADSRQCSLSYGAGEHGAWNMDYCIYEGNSSSRQQTMFPLLWGRRTWGLEHGLFMREIVPADNVPISCGAMEHGVRN